MDNNNLIQQLQREMGKLGCDARAEPQLVMSMEEGITYDDFMVSCDSLFYREYSKDVVFTELKEDARKCSLLQLHLSRSGFYDHLPEGLFYQPAEVRSRKMAAADMALEYRLNKQKELSLRRFFLPVENDFFWQRMQVEKEESKLLQELKGGMVNDYCDKLWNISPSIPRTLRLPLILLIPYAAQIAGDLSLTAKCLELLLQERVSIYHTKAPVTNAGLFFCQALGQQQLGVDLLCGEQFREDYPLLRLTIGPLQHSQVTDYLEGGSRWEFLATFYRFFIPVGADVQTQLEVRAEEMNMHLAAESAPLLGYSSALAS